MDRNTVLLAVYIFVFTMVCIYGLHRYQLVYLYYKHRRNTPRIQRRFQRLPRVTVQLPMYNERYVARRVIELACGIEYPRDRLQIQVLDDSTDDTVEVARQAVEDMRRLGHEIVYIHRDNRHGYKAGALQEGLETATGEFVCIFDADFLPRRPGGDGAGPLGAHQPRLLAADQDSGGVAGRPLRHGARGPQPFRPVHEL
ncbi:MAG: glycosyltransferase [Planctomycetota bacterium]|jgi:cellulose synthase/poly-beta-1,6-N-acetylglucosamine synthase-like glycosyltransferase